MDEKAFISDESNDMIMNQPDIESIEALRNQMDEDKEMRQLQKELKIENKKLIMEEKRKVREQHKQKKIEAEMEHRKLKKEKAIQKIEVEMEIKRLKEEKAKVKMEEEIENKKLKEEKKQKRLEEAEEQKEKKLEMKLKALEEKKIADEAKKNKALKGMKYLLNISEKYSDFFREKLINLEKGSAEPHQEINKLKPTMSDMKKVVNIDQTPMEKDITKQLAYFENGELRQYQIDGVQWLNTLFENGINGILADEMGLGKTVQVIALICHLLERKIPGPYFIVAPLSTIPNWELEFKRFAPKVPVVVLHGNEQERRMQCKLIRKKQEVGNFHTYPVVLTTYQMPLMEMQFLSQLQMQYIIIDEGHRIKNHESRLAVGLRRLNSSNRLLLTGTPIHNNITELWSLLNFLMPHIFNNVDTFASLLLLEDMKDENKLLEQEEKTNLISTLHRVIEPFVLRRLKKDVLDDVVPKKEVNIFCPLSKLQRDLYNFVLNKNMEKLTRTQTKESLGPRKKKPRINYYENKNDDDFSDYEEEILEAEKILPSEIIKKEEIKVLVRLTMQNPLMMFKKIVDHPYLVHFPLDPEAPTKSLLINEDLITSSGKMVILDQILKYLKENGHKVLIFSTLVMCLDLIEELFIMRGYAYSRLDGSYGLGERKDSIESFNKDPNVLGFLLSTRAGGLGLNLTGADTVIFFDRDWNPQADIQAQDRCHRIGQTKPVFVYTLVTKNTIDERVIERGYQKRLLEKIVIKDGKFQKLKSEMPRIESELRDLQKLLQEESDYFQDLAVPADELDRLLDRSELYAQINMVYKNGKNNSTPIGGKKRKNSVKKKSS